MSQRRYAVVQVGEEWRIVGQRQMGHFPCRDSAALATARLAAQAVQEGYQVELLIQERFGQLKAVRPKSEPDVAERAWRQPADVASAHGHYRRNSGPMAVAIDKAARREPVP